MALPCPNACFSLGLSATSDNPSKLLDCIGNTIAPTQAKMKELGKTYEPHIFEGAQHGFLRAQTGGNGANMKATQQAWPLAVAWIKKHAS